MFFEIDFEEEEKKLPENFFSFLLFFWGKSESCREQKLLQKFIPYCFLFTKKNKFVLLKITAYVYVGMLKLVEFLLLNSFFSSPPVIPLLSQQSYIIPEN
jgi:hypothetical protein